MKNIVIGIHGLKNKVTVESLYAWWDISLHQALRNAGLKNFPFRLELIYWADLLYPFPLDPVITDEKDPRYLSFPFKYLTPPSEPSGSTLRRLTRNGIEKLADFLMHSDSIYHNLEDLSEKFIRHHFRDLDVYLNNGTGYHEAQSRNVRQAITERVIETLHRHKSQKIMIIAHSMGSIIIYDVLSSLLQNDIQIDTLVTLGSPLGQSTVMGKLSGQNPVKQKLKTPENIKNWYNLSDIRDIITINYDLEDDFYPNSKNVKPQDYLVNNNYTWEDKTNPHSVFGYLQTPQCGQALFDFLVKDMSSWQLTISSYLQKFREHILKREANLYKSIPIRQEEKIKAGKPALSPEERFKEQLES
ncbi:MAG: alpha/beta hydrolase [candidate division KSB1 bacterium]|nr:alpha/beta hydrolase [candidate division KSB1 bacterium]